MSQIMKRQVHDPGPLASTAKCSTKPACVVERKQLFTIRLTHEAAKSFFCTKREGNHAFRAIFGLVEYNVMPVKVHTRPLEPDDLAGAHARLNRQNDCICKLWSPANGTLSRLEEALFFIVFKTTVSMLGRSRFANPWNWIVNRISPIHNGARNNSGKQAEFS